jgi:signal peptidase I
MVKVETIPARRTEGREQQYKRQRRLNAFMTTLLILMVLAALFFIWFLPVRVSGDSMSPSLLDGETVLIDRLGRFWKKPGRGDMVAFTTDDGVFIKRIVGLPGETVEVKEGRVYIDSRPLDESMYVEQYLGDDDPVLVPEGSVYVLGDNRRKVYDSRLESVGCIPYSSLTGILRVRVSPLGRFTLFF